MSVPMKVGRRIGAPKNKGEGRKPEYKNKTKQQARAEIIAKRARKENINGKTNNV